MRDPFLLDGPATIAFSGGRTSGVMLHNIIRAHGGSLPDDVVPVFCNTGKEHNATLDFVQECAERWGVLIRWIEWRDADEPRDRWREVTHATASRDGEPFAAVIRRKSYLPNPVKRFCTVEMKIHATHKYLQHGLGWDDGYNKAIGLRYDEPHRVARARGRAAAGGDPWSLSFPLYNARLTVRDVVGFWRGQPFDLGLPLAPNGTTPTGNCDLCFLKGAGKLSSIIAAEPHRAQWWADQEAAIGATFRKDRPSYAAMMQQMQLLPPDDDTPDCNCTY